MGQIWGHQCRRPHSIFTSSFRPTSILLFSPRTPGEPHWKWRLAPFSRVNGGLSGGGAASLVSNPGNTASWKAHLYKVIRHYGDLLTPHMLHPDRHMSAAANEDWWGYPYYFITLHLMLSYLYCCSEPGIYNLAFWHSQIILTYCIDT